MGERKMGAVIPHLKATKNAVVDQYKRIGLPECDIRRALRRKGREVCANTSIAGSRRTLGTAIDNWVTSGRSIAHAGDKPV
jgi:hypothetical protein